MDYLKNHCWCSSSNWDGGHYDCQIIVGLNSYADHNKEDFESITTKVKALDKDAYNDMAPRWRERGFQEDCIREMFIRSYNTLKPEVIEWLNVNVPDDKDGNKMWCIGSEEYLMNDRSGINIFFQQRRHAMAFIKRWSKWKKPVMYTQYFTDVRKTLNLETLRYEDRT